MFIIEYGPTGRRVIMPGLQALQVIPRAEMLMRQGAIDLKITDSDGKVSNLSQFRLDLAHMVA